MRLVSVAPLVFLVTDLLHGWAAGYPLLPLYLPILLVAGGAIATLALAMALLDRSTGQSLGIDLLATWPIALAALFRITALPIEPVSRNLWPVGITAAIASVLVLLASRRTRPGSGHLSTLHVSLPVVIAVFVDSSTLAFLAAFAVATGLALLPARVVPAGLARRTVGLAVVTTLALSLWDLHHLPVRVDTMARFETSLEAKVPEPTHGNPGASQTTSGQNEIVILIVLDTTRKDVLDLKAQQSPAPNLQKLAEDGIVLDRCMANSPWTPPAHASMFTGLYPPQHGVTRGAQFGNIYPLSPECTTLAEQLSQGAVRTAAFAANPYLKSVFGLLRGFQDQVFIGDEAAPALVEVHDQNLQRLARRFPGNRWLRRSHQSNRNNMASSKYLFDAAATWLLDLPRDNPTFLFINVMDQHYLRYLHAAGDLPHRVGPKYYWEGDADLLRHPEDHATRHAELHQWYRDSLPYQDWELGRFIDRLEEAGLYDHATVIVTSDHGNLFGEHGHYDHGTSIHTGNVSIPLIVKYGSNHVDRAPDEDRILQQIDFFAEILDLFGLQSPPESRGATFTSPQGSLPLAYLYRRPPHEIDESVSDILDRDLLGTVVTFGGQEYQYVVTSDAEQRLYPLDSTLQIEGPDVFDKMSEHPALLEFLRLSPTLFRRRSDRDGDAPVVDAETLDLLQSLGYIN